MPVEGLNASLQASRRALKLKLNEEDAGQDPRSPARRGTVTVRRTMLQTVGEENARSSLFSSAGGQALPPLVPMQEDMVPRGSKSKDRAASASSLASDASVKGRRFVCVCRHSSFAH